MTYLDPHKLFTRKELRAELDGLVEEAGVGMLTINALKCFVQEIHFQASLMHLHGRGETALSSATLAKITAWTDKLMAATR